MLNNLFAKKNQAQVEEDDNSSISEWVGEKDLENSLPITVYQTDKNVIIKSSVAGINPKDLKISLHNDLLTIKGKIEDNCSAKEEDYFYKECFFGSFSRSIILPAEVDTHRVDASLENGILLITLHKTNLKKIEVKTKN